MKIVVALDLSPFSKSVIDQAETIATACSASLIVVHVAAPDPDFVGYEAGPQVVRDDRSDQLHAEHVELQRIAEDLRGRGLDAKALLIQGPTVEAILSVSEDAGAYLIVIGSHGHSALARAWLGSVSTKIVQQSPIPVLVIPMSGRGAA